MRVDATSYPFVVVVDFTARLFLGAFLDLSREVKVLGRVRLT